MVALSPGVHAPDLALKTTSGSTLKLSEILQLQPLALLAFFKVSCPVCQFTFPFLERLHQAYPQVPIWGVSQDDHAESSAFASEYGCTFPILLDEDLSLTVKYGLTNVPSLFLVDKSGQVKLTSVGFVKDELEQINKIMSEVSGNFAQLFADDESVPGLRPG